VSHATFGLFLHFELCLYLPVSKTYLGSITRFNRLLLSTEVTLMILGMWKEDHNYGCTSFSFFQHSDHFVPQIKKVSDNRFWKNKEIGYITQILSLLKIMTLCWPLYVNIMSVSLKLNMDDSTRNLRQILESQFLHLYGLMLIIRHLYTEGDYCIV
jgi:hypothetical protein